MTSRFQDFSAQELAMAIDTNFGDMLRMMGNVPGAAYYEEQGLCRLVTELQHPFANMIWGGAFTAESAPSGIQSALEPIVAKNLPALWIVGSSASPANLPKMLISAGLSHAGDLAGMAIDLNANTSIPIPRGIAFREVLNDEDLFSWTKVLARGYELPNEIAGLFSSLAKCYGLGQSSAIRFYIAELDGVPSACSMLTLFSGVAGVYCVATLPEVRNNGLGSVVTSGLLHVAKQCGYRMVVLQASPMGYPLYCRIGFKEFGKMSIYMRQSDS